jgi:sortase A
MPDRRSVDELSIEELERILAIRKRQAREATLRRLQGEGRLVDVERPSPAANPGVSGETVNTAGARYRVADPDATADVRRRRAPVWRTWRDRLLLLVEVGALVGLVLVIVGIEQTRRELNRDVAIARDANRPTPEPTPLLTAVVLPSGHKPPTDSGEPEPNLDEIPAHLRPYVQSITPPPPPTPGPGQPIRLDIPALNLIGKPIVPGTDWEQLKKGVGHHPGTANPGERGNLVLAAHNDIFGEIFRDLDRLRPGDEIIVHTLDRTYRYVVAETRLVEPTQIDVMNPTSEPTVTLISCYPYLIDTQRIVVIAALQS